MMVVSTSVGSPFRRYGLYFHCCTADTALARSISGPDTTLSCSTEPVFEYCLGNVSLDDQGTAITECASGRTIS